MEIGSAVAMYYDGPCGGQETLLLPEGLVKFFRILFIAAVFLSSGNSALAANANVAKVYNLPGHGQLRLNMPEGWNAELRHNAGTDPLSIFISGFDGSPFVVFITPRFPDSQTARDFGTPKSVHDMVAKRAHDMEKQAVEDNLSIVTMGGGGGPGYYFDATDPSPKPGEFKYMTVGAVAVGGVVCTFSIFTNHKESVVKNKALNMVSRAGWRPGGH